MLNKKLTLSIHPNTFKREFEEKPKADIVDIYEKLIGGQIKITGKATLVKCCFHHEDTPSLALYPSTSSYFCFGCQKHGDIFDFVEEVLGCSFKEALQFIKDNGR
jgi:DNA primase